MKNLPSFALALALFGASITVHAQRLSPGLWETTMAMKAQGGEMEAAGAKMQEQMAAMPPEQRKMMEEMMAKRGVAVSGGGMNTSVRSCISKERAERGDLPEQGERERNCKRDSVERSGSTVKFKISCSNPPSTGAGEFTFSSDKAYSGKLVFDTQAHGKPQRMEMQQQAKWLGADCGSVAAK